MKNKTYSYSDYYFCLVDDETDDHYELFIIALKTYWDLNHFLDDFDLTSKQFILPENFNEVEESVFEYKGSSEKGKSLLIELGLTENNALQP